MFQRPGEWTGWAEEGGDGVFVARAEHAFRMEQEKGDAFHRPAGTGRGGEHGAHPSRLEAEAAVLRGTVPPEGEPQVGRTPQEPERPVVRPVLDAVSRADAAACHRHRGFAKGVGKTDALRA